MTEREALAEWAMWVARCLGAFFLGLGWDGHRHWASITALALFSAVILLRVGVWVGRGRVS